MSNSRRHHFIPQMLSKRFTNDDGKLYVFDKDKIEKGVESRTPKGVFWKPHFHTSRTVDGKKNITLEDDFSRLESDTNPVIEKMVSAVRKGEKPNLTEREKETWDRFFFTQWKRTPDSIQKIDIDEIFYDVVKKAVTEIEATRPLYSNELQFLDDPKQVAQLKQDGKVGALKKEGLKTLGVLSNRGLVIARISSANKSFIIGSYPVLRLITTDGRTQLSDPNVEAWLPIAHDIIVTPFLTKGEEKVVAINDKVVRRLNLLFAKQSTTIAGRSEELIRSLANPR